MFAAAAAFPPEQIVCTSCELIVCVAPYILMVADVMLCALESTTFPVLLIVAKSAVFACPTVPFKHISKQSNLASDFPELNVPPPPPLDPSTALIDLAPIRYCTLILKEHCTTLDFPCRQLRTRVYSFDEYTRC